MVTQIVRTNTNYFARLTPLISSFSTCGDCDFSLKSPITSDVRGIITRLHLRGQRSPVLCTESLFPARKRCTSPSRVCVLRSRTERSMRKTPVTSASRKKHDKDAEGLLPVSEVKPLTESWLLAGDVSQHSEKTLTLRRGIMDRFVWWCKWAEVEEVTPDAVRQFLLYLRRGHEQHKGQETGRWGDTLHTRCQKPASASTVHTYFRNLRTFFNWCVREEIIESSPMERIDAPVDRSDQIQPFTPEQITALTNAAKKIGPRDHALCLLLFDTGIRAGEIHSLQVRDVDLATNQIRVREGKGGKFRTVPFSPDTRRALYEWRRSARRITGGAAEDEAPFFLSLRGRYAGQGLTEYALGGIVDKWGKEAGVKGVRCSPHTFRHTFAISYLRIGGDLISLQRILGHSDLEMTNRYVAMSQTDINKQHAKFSPVAAMRRGAL